MKQESALCPNCGAKGLAGNKCEFCGTFIPLPVAQAAKENKLNDDERIVNSSRTKDTVIASLLNLLADTKDVSAELFEDIEIEETKKYLIPFYSYEGEYQAPWTCVKLVKETYKYKNENGTTKYKTKTKRYPMNGVATGSYNILYPSCNIEQLPEAVSSFVTKVLTDGDCIPGNAIDYRKLDSEENECLVEDNGKSEKFIWADFNGDNDVEQLASESVSMQFPSDYEDDSWSYTSHRKAGVKILIPIWLLTYTSEGKKYSYVSDDYSAGKIFEYSVDEDYSKESSNIKKQSESNSIQGCLIGTLGIILGIVAFGCIFSNVTRASIDSHEDIILRLYMGDLSFVGFTICFLVMKKAMRESYENDYHLENYELQHMTNVYTKLLNNILVPNKFNLEDSTRLALANILKEKLSNTKVPTLTKSCTWVWPVIIVFLIFVLLVNIACIA